MTPSRLAQSVARLTQEQEILDSIPGRPHSFDSPLTDLRRAGVSYWPKYVHLVLVSKPAQE